MARSTLRIHQAGLSSWPVVAVMSRPVVAISAHASLVDALWTMRNASLRHLAVVDRGGHCRGVLSDRQVAAEFALRPAALGSVRVGDVVDEAVAAVTWQATVGEVAREMRHHGTDAVVVVDPDGVPVGLITASDLVGLLAKPATRATSAAPAPAAGAAGPAHG
jgi:CBS domain-containing protein